MTLPLCSIGKSASLDEWIDDRFCSDHKQIRAKLLRKCYSTKFGDVNAWIWHSNLDKHDEWARHCWFEWEIKSPFTIISAFNFIDILNDLKRFIFLSFCQTACITETICCPLELTGNAYSCLQIYNRLAQYKGYQCELCPQCSHIIKIHWLPLSEIQNVHCFGKQNVVRRSLAPVSWDCPLAWAINRADQWFWSVILADWRQTSQEEKYAIIIIWHSSMDKISFMHEKQHPIFVTTVKLLWRTNDHL